jgi:hypothetical protein
LVTCAIFPLLLLLLLRLLRLLLLLHFTGGTHKHM